MTFATLISSRFDLKIPVIQAPLAGGGDTPDLVAAACASGVLGSIGAAYLAPEAIDRAVHAVRARCARPFAINLFAPQPVESPLSEGAITEQLGLYHDELGLPPPAIEAAPDYTFAEQFQVALSLRPAVFSFTLGLLPGELVEAAKVAGSFVMGTATTVEEALALEENGVDAVVVQGSEAGGHRATFSAEPEAGMIGTMSLVPQVADAVRVPVIASGGIMDGRGVVAALALGASGAQLGTAFLLCDEAGIPGVYRRAILAADECATRMTRVFSGRPARGIVNRFMREMEESGDTILPFPFQNTLTRPLRAAAARQGRAEFLSLWAGQGLRLSRSRSASRLVADLEGEMGTAFQRLCDSRTDA